MRHRCDPEQVTKEINGKTYILIGNEQQLRAIGSGKKVIGRINKVTQTCTGQGLFGYHWVDGASSTEYAGDADLADSDTLRNADASDYDNSLATCHTKVDADKTRTRYYGVGADGTQADYSAANTGLTYSADANYLIFRDIDLSKNAADTASTEWTPLMFSGTMLGAARARKELDIRSFENPAWQYAAIRNLLYRRGKAIELLGCYEPSFRYFAGWWQQLFGESEGKDGKGLFPATVEFTADLHSLGQMIQQGQRNLFETIVRFAPPRKRTTIEVDWKNLDGLNYLEGKTLDFVEEQAFQGTLSAHVDGGVPNIVLQTDEVDADTLGELFYFFELSCGISAYMLGVNPFNQPGVEFYKKNMFHLLGKPGY